MKKEIVCIALMAIMVTSMLAAIQVQPVKASSTPLFSMTLVAPGNANLLRRQWALIIADDFQSAGINANVVFLGWSSVYDRILYAPPSIQGLDWNHGGYDALFIGWTPGNPAAPFFATYAIYYSGALPPNQNYMLYNSSASDQDLANALANGYDTQGIQAYMDWQNLTYTQVPASQLFWTDMVMPASSSINFNGWDWVFDNIGPTTQFLTGPNSVVLASTGSITNLNPPISSAWYDFEVFSTVFDALYTMTPNYQYVPDLATAAPTVSNNGHTYTYPIRQGVQFQDGVNMTVDDIVFSWLAYLNAADGSAYSATFSSLMGNDINFTWLNGTTTTLLLNLTSSQAFYPASAAMIAQFAASNSTTYGSVTALNATAVQVNIPDFPGTSLPAATFHVDGEPAVIVPLHVFNGIDPSTWAQMPFNTGTGTYTANGMTFTGPMGTGPYMFVSYDPTSQIVNETKFTNYWNATGLQSQGMFNIKNFYIRFIADKDGAIAELKNNDVQILDGQYQLNTDYLAGNLNFATNHLLNASGMQQLGYNMRDPIWGTGTATPLGQSNPHMAAQAAQDVRLAFDYLIPRAQLCQSLEGGLAEPGSVHVNPLSPYYNSACVPRELNLTMALAYLAAAGYNTGVAPIGTGGGGGTSGTGINTGTLSNPFTTLPALITDQPFPLTFKGNFTVDPTQLAAHGGVMIVLEKSYDGINWTGVAFENSTNGAYSLSYTPTDSATQMYHVVMTGIGADVAAANGFNYSAFPYYTLPDSDTFAAVAISTPITYNSAGSNMMALQSQTNASYNNLVGFLNSSFGTLNNQISSLNSQISSLNSQISSLNTTVSNQASTISSLNSQIGNITNYMYIAIVVAIIAILIGIVAMVRKR